MTFNAETVLWPDVSSARGAPMGRTSDSLANAAGAEITLARVPMVDSCYDPGGAYWGAGDSSVGHMFGWYCEASDSRGYFRAADLDAASAHIAERAPGCTISIHALPPRLCIELCPNEPRASAYLPGGASVTDDSDIAEALADCTASGDVSGACERVLDELGVEFRIVARNAAGEYENRLATDEEKAATCRAIYCDSDSDFSDTRTAETYLVWEAAAGVESEHDCNEGEDSE